MLIEQGHNWGFILSNNFTFARIEVSKYWKYTLGLNYIKQLAGQTAVYGLGVVVPRLLTYLLLTPFYTRVFERAEYGIITELYAYVVFLP